MLNSDLIASFAKICAQNNRFLVISHVRPDGDAYGSTLALALSLQVAGKDVVATNADGLSPLFEFLPGSKNLNATRPDLPEADRLIIAVDCADKKRLGTSFDAW